MKNLVMICVVAGLVLAGAAQANIATWSTGSAFVKNMGNTTSDGRNEFGQTNTECDKVTLDIASGTLDLVAGTPVVVLVNPLSFQIGWTGDMTEEETKLNVYTLTRDLTVNGVTKSLVQTMTHGVTYYRDSLIVNDGAAVIFGDIKVTPLAWTTGFFTDEGGLYTQTSPSWHTISAVYAQFEVVPEPMTLGLLAFGGLMLRRRMA
jgi:hypothetical protein